MTVFRKHWPLLAAAVSFALWLVPGTASRTTPSIPHAAPRLSSREDAVARVLRSRSHSMSDAEALRAARALCDEAKRTGQDPLLFLALIHVESSYDHRAVSPVGAMGLMQLMPRTAAAMSEPRDGRTSTALDPAMNVRLGVRFFAELHKQFGRLDHSLTAYNRGAQATRSLLKENGELPASVVDRYATKVLNRYHAFKAAYGHLPRS